MTTQPVPDHIAADTYTGKARIRGNVRSGVFTSAELAAMIGAGNTSALFEYSGHLRNGQPLYVRTRFYSDGAKIYGYDAAGQMLIIHPAERKIRVHTK